VKSLPFGKRANTWADGMDVYRVMRFPILGRRFSCSNAMISLSRATINNTNDNTRY